MIKLFFIIILIHFSRFADAKTYSYCVPDNNINFNPFREIKNGKDLAYLIFTRPYISTNADEKGLLAAYEFSPDGHIFRAKIDPTAKWSDGTTLSARDAALGIAKGFHYRTIGARVHVDAVGITKENWSKRSYPGIKIIDNESFEIHFESKIENLTGVVREALSTNSRHNRVWPIRTDENTAINDELIVPSEVIGVNGLVIKPKKQLLIFPGKEDNVRIISTTNCQSADMSLYLNLYETTLEKYSFEKNPAQQAAIVILNSNKLSIQKRKIISLWIREQCKNLPTVFGMKLAEGFFLKNEPGYLESKNWSGTISFKSLRYNSFKAVSEIPVYQQILEKGAKRDHLLVKFNDPGLNNDVDFQIISTAVSNGRLVFLQDYLTWRFASENFLSGAPATKKALENIASQSASTIPPNNKTLQALEHASNEEWSIVPLVRRNTLAFSKLNIPFFLFWTKDGDLRIGPKLK